MKNNLFIRSINTFGSLKMKSMKFHCIESFTDFVTPNKLGHKNP